jgi:hypothetical protein
VASSATQRWGPFPKSHPRASLEDSTGFATPGGSSWDRVSSSPVPDSPSLTGADHARCPEAIQARGADAGPFVHDQRRGVFDPASPRSVPRKTPQPDGDTVIRTGTLTAWALTEAAERNQSGVGNPDGGHPLRAMSSGFGSRGGNDRRLGVFALWRAETAGLPLSARGCRGRRRPVGPYRNQPIFST